MINHLSSMTPFPHVGFKHRGEEFAESGGVSVSEEVFLHHHTFERPRLQRFDVAQRT